MLEWICHLRCICPSWKSPEGIAFTMSVRNTFVRGALGFCRSSIMAFLCRTHLTVETGDTNLGNLTAMKVIGSLGGRG